MTLRNTGTLIAVCLCLFLILGAAPSKTMRSDNTTTPSAAVKQTAQPAATPHLSQEIIEAPLSQSSRAANYDIPWSSINGGGAPSASTNYSVNASVGQSAIGFATSTNYEAGIGYWYGAEATVVGCSCPFQCDFNEDNFLDAIDLNAEITALFFNGPNPQDPNCPATRADFNYDGVPDASDLNLLIDHLFFNGPPPTDPCA